MLFLACDWSPLVAVMIAFTVFFYIMDIEVTMEKWSLVDLNRSK
jgi:hypothetical protein